MQGEEHSHTLTAMNNLAATLKGLGDLVATRKLQEQVLETRRRLLGEEHPDTLTAKKNLARMKPRTLRHWLQLMLGGWVVRMSRKSDLPARPTA